MKVSRKVSSDAFFGSSFLNRTLFHIESGVVVFFFFFWKEKISESKLNLVRLDKPTDWRCVCVCSETFQPQEHYTGQSEDACVAVDVSVHLKSSVGSRSVLCAGHSGSSSLTLAIDVFMELCARGQRHGGTGLSLLEPEKGNCNSDDLDNCAFSVFFDSSLDTIHISV